LVHQRCPGCFQQDCSRGISALHILQQKHSREKEHPPPTSADPIFKDLTLETSLFERLFPAIFFIASVALASAQAPTAPGKPLPPGTALPKIKATCTQCHDTGRIGEQHRTRQEWSGELKKMEGLGAEIPDADRSAILDYLTRNFGPASGAAKPPAKKPASAAN
jgi:hypothetical protein